MKDDLIAFLRQHDAFIGLYGPDEESVYQAINEFFDSYQPERSKREDGYFIEFGSATGLLFNTSEGIKRLEPGKRYDENLNEITDAVL